MADNPAEELLRHVEWLQDLALTLVDDRDLADDAAQDACAAALERPPATWSAPRAWLATVLRRTVARSRRRSARRLAVERAVPPRAEAPGSVSVSDEIELHRQLVDEVRRLDEPFRTAVVLRFFHGLTPSQIARRTDVPPGTVRSRIARGLERIRAGLDRRHGGRRDLWCAALMTTLALPSARATGVSGVLGGAYVMKKSVIAVVVLMVLVAGWALVEVFDAPTDDSFEGVSSEEAPESAATRRHVDRAQVPSAETEAGSEPVAPAVKSPDARRTGPSFRVVCRDTAGAAVEGAWVAVAHGAEASRLRALTDLSAWEGRHGPALKTASDGCVTIPGDKRAALVMAVGPDGAFGQWSRRQSVERLTGRFSAERESPLGFDVRNRGAAAQQEDSAWPVEVTLQKHDVFAVRTVNPDGTPRGAVPLRWRSARGGKEDRFSGKPAWHSCRSHATSGVALIRRSTGQGSGSVEVEARILAREIPSVTLPPAPSSGKPIDLRLPPLGAVEASVQDRTGAVIQFVHFRASTEDDATVLWRENDAVATWEHVEVGLTMKLKAWTLGGTSEAVVSGPDRIDERAERVLPAAEDALVVTGRLLDDRGDPLRESRFLLTGMRPGSPEVEFKARWCALRTDGDGRFRTDISIFGKAPPAGSRVSVAGLAERDETHRRIDDLAGEATVPAPLDGVIDLGDVMLHALPVLVAGRVVDADGRPIAGAVVEAHPDIKAVGEDMPVMLARDRGRSTTNFGPGSLMITTDGWHATGPRDYQVARVGSTPVTRADGSFVIRWSGVAGLVPEVRVEAFRGRYVQAAPVRAATGAEDVTVTMTKGFLLRGELRGARELAQLRVDLVLGEEEGHAFELPLTASGAFRTERSLGTTADLRVVIRDTGEELARRAVEPPSPDVEVLDAGTFDLASVLTQIAIDVVDANGASIEEARVLRNTPAAPDRFSGVPAAASPLLSYRSGSPPSLRVAAVGFLPRELRAASEDMTVTLERAPDIVLAIANPGALPAAPYGLVATLWRVTGPGSLSSVGGPVAVTGAETTLPTEGPATYRVALEVVKGSGRDARGARLLRARDADPVVLDASRDGRIVITLDGAAVASAVEKLE